MGEREVGFFLVIDSRKRGFDVACIFFLRSCRKIACLYDLSAKGEGEKLDRERDCRHDSNGP